MKLTPEQRQLEKLVRQQHPGLLSNLPGDKKKHILEVLQGPSAQAHSELTVTQTMTTSPVPPAELLQGYNAAFPDGGSRLFALVENQSQHRQKVEMAVITAQIERMKWGQIIAAILTVVFGALAAFCAHLGHAALAGTVATTTVVALAGIFVSGRRAQERNLDKKAPQ